MSNVSLEQLQQFAAVCPLSACQPKYNMLQREIEADIVPWCVAQQVSLVVYWPLMKWPVGWQARKRDHVFDPTDGRAKYPMFQGEEWQKNQDLVDALRAIGRDAQKSVDAEVVINWTIHRPGITTALCGAKRPEQLQGNAGALGWSLSASQLAAIDQALAARGQAVSRNAVGYQGRAAALHAHRKSRGNLLWRATWRRN